jgi:hypothetical protein
MAHRVLKGWERVFRWKIELSPALAKEWKRTNAAVA